MMRVINQVWTQLIEDIRSMSLKEHLGYWIIPVIVLGILITFYFSGNPKLVQIVCPTENWEWGILENIQLVLLSVIFTVTLIAALRKKAMLQKIGFALLALFSLFVFLEEIDYGAHLQHFLRGSKDSLLGEFYNVHNQGNNARIFKRSVYVIMGLGFVIAPFLNDYFDNKWIKYLIPKPKILIVAILAIIVDRVPRLLVKFDIFEDGGLGVNIGEFSEIIVYQIFLIYLLQVIYEKTWHHDAK